MSKTCKVPVDQSNAQKTVCGDYEAVDGFYAVPEMTVCETQCSAHYGFTWDPHHDEWMSGSEFELI